MHRWINRKCQYYLCIGGWSFVTIFLIIGLACLGARNYLNGEGSAYHFISSHGMNALLYYRGSDWQTAQCWQSGFAFAIILVPIFAFFSIFFSVDYCWHYRKDIFAKKLVDKQKILTISSEGKSKGNSDTAEKSEEFIAKTENNAKEKEDQNLN